MLRLSLRAGFSAMVGVSALVVLGAGCLAEPIGAEKRCVYGGTAYRPGDRFPATDGCNSCSCGTDGIVGCTLMGCVEPGCSYDGKRYATGATFPSTDGCNTCSCGVSGVACTEKYCAPDAGDAGKDASSDAAGACMYAGKLYPDGATFPATDGCNTCACTAGSVACTKKACIDAGDAGDAGFTCPPDGTINCMPVVPPQLARLCSGPEHDFIVAKCPGVSFVY